MCANFWPKTKNVNQIQSDIPPQSEMNPVTSHHNPWCFGAASRSNATEGWDGDPPRDHTPGTCSGLDTPAVTRSGHLGS